MKLINLDIVDKLLYEDHESIELMVYTKTDLLFSKNKNEFDLSDFYELENSKYIKPTCERIRSQVKDLSHIDFKIIYEDTDYNQVTIYKH